MISVSDWMCPYCRCVQWTKVDLAGAPPLLQPPLLATCDAEQGGCGGLVVLNVKEIRVEWNIRRVEGEGAAEDGGAMPGRPVAPLQVETDDAPTLAELPDEVIEPLIEALANPVTGMLGPEHVVVEPLKGTNGNGAIKFKWTGFDHEVGRLQVGRDFTMLPKSTRKRLVNLCGQQIAAHVKEPPSRKQWDMYKPSWMTTASSVELTYLVPLVWGDASREWHLQAKGLA